MEKYVLLKRKIRDLKLKGEDLNMAIRAARSAFREAEEDIKVNLTTQEDENKPMQCTLDGVEYTFVMKDVERLVARGKEEKIQITADYLGAGNIEPEPLVALLEEKGVEGKTILKVSSKKVKPMSAVGKVRKPKLKV